MKVAVLALQGAFAEHETMLQRLGADTFQVRQLSDWQQHKDALVIPGGESTTQLNLLESLNLLVPIRNAIHDGLPVFGTCAGMILLACQEDGKPRQGFGTMDIDVRRNAYGRQMGSFHTVQAVNGIGDDIPMTFIRAPYAHGLLSSSAQVLAQVNGHIVAVRQDRQLATAFHPELTDDTRMHEFFLRMATH